MVHGTVAAAELQIMCKCLGQIELRALHRIDKLATLCQITRDRRGERAARTMRVLRFDARLAKPELRAVFSEQQIVCLSSFEDVIAHHL